mgnify:CR=1 FL=1
MPVIINGSTGISGTDGSAATPAVQGTDTNTGMYFPGDDRIGFTEGGTQVGEFDASGNFLFNSGYGSVARAFGCRAWVNFNGTGTVAIRASGNVTSITDNNAGDYTVNFTTAMPDANYAGVATCRPEGDTVNGSTITSTGLTATTTFRVSTKNQNNVLVDSSAIHVAIFR